MNMTGGKLAADREYRQVCLDSCRKWRAAHPEYWKQYRREHPDTVGRNRENEGITFCDSKEATSSSSSSKRKSGESASDCGELVGLYLVELGQIPIEQHLLASDEEDATFDQGNRGRFGAGHQFWSGPMYGGSQGAERSAKGPAIPFILRVPPESSPGR
jgi:hypothetical protein